MRGWGTEFALLIGLTALLSSCGPVQVRGRCSYADLVGQCALMEVDDGDWIGPPGVFRARYRIVQTDGTGLTYHLILKASSDPEFHDYTRRYLREHLSVTCRLGALKYGKDSCPAKRVELALPEPEFDVHLKYEVTHVSADEARMTREKPFGEGRTDAWP